MNDLDLIERFRSEVPEPDEVWLQRLRSELVARPASEGRRSLRWRPQRRAVVALVAAAMVVALVLVGSALLPVGGPAGPDPAVAGVLRRFARIAANSPAEVPPTAGKYVYWKTTSLTTYLFFPGPDLATFAYQVPTVEERWFGLDGSGRSVIHVGEATFLTALDRAAYEAFLASPAAAQWEFDWGERYEDRFAPGELTPPVLDPATYPADADRLRAQLVQEEALGGSNGDWGVFTWAVDLLAVSHMSPELRAAFFEVMSTVPGTELIGPVEDEVGRRGIAIGYTRDGVRDEVIFERATGDILEIRTVNVGGDPGGAYDVGQDVCCGEFAWPGTVTGTVMHASVYVSDAVVVDSTHERP